MDTLHSLYERIRKHMAPMDSPIIARSTFAAKRMKIATKRMKIIGYAAGITDGATKAA